MKRIVLSPLPVKLDKAALMEQNHIDPESDLAEEFSDLVDAAQKVLRCKTVLVAAEPGMADYPAGYAPKYFYAMTVGTEIEEDEDCDYPYLGDVVRQAALDGAMAATVEYLKASCGMVSPVFRNPGSEADWDQLVTVELVQLLNAGEIGVQSDSRGNMTPWYSTVGLFTEA